MDRNDPLIPMPWQMDDIRAYRAAKQSEAIKKSMELEQAMLNLEKARGETMTGRASEAEQIAMIEERSRQRREGTAIGPEVGVKMIQTGGPSLLEATEMQKNLEVQNRAEQARLGAIRQYGVEKGLTPTAKIDMGGMSATVPFESAGERMSNSYQMIYESMTPRLAGAFEREGYGKEEAFRMASEQMRKELVKASSSGKVMLMGAGGGTISYSNEQAERMWRDPKTPKVLKSQLDEFFGPSETPKAASWINTRLGR